MAAAFVAPPSGGVIKYCRSVPRLRLCQGSVLLLAWGCGGGGGGVECQRDGVSGGGGQETIRAGMGFNPCRELGVMERRCLAEEWTAGRQRRLGGPGTSDCSHLGPISILFTSKPDIKWQP